MLLRPVVSGGSADTGSAEAKRTLFARPTGMPWRLRHHVSLIAFVLVSLLFVLDAQHSWTRDDGFYAVQTAAVANGEWGVETPYAVSEAAARSLEITDGVRYSYTRHPAWPTLQAAPYEVFGSVGLRILPLLAVLAGSCAAWAVASRHRIGTPSVAFWFVAGSPLLLHGTGFWAIAPAAALGGVALLSALQGARRGASVGWYAVLATTLVGAGMLRSEGVILAVAVAMASLALPTRRLLTTATAVSAAAAVHLVESAWIDSIVEAGASGGSVQRSFDGGTRLGAAATSLWSGGYVDPLGSMLGVLGLLATVVAVYGWARGGAARENLVSLALVVAVGMYALRTLVAGGDMITGLFAAWPIAMFAVLAGWREPAERFLVAVAALVGGAVLATQYSDGGGLQWGGRFFAVAIVPLAVLASGGVARMVERAPALRSRVTALAVVPALVGLLAVVTMQANHADAIDSVVVHDPDIVLSATAGLPHLAWSDAIDTGRIWLHVPPEELPFVVAQIDRGRVATVGYDPEALAAGFESVSSVSVGSDLRLFDLG